MEEVPALPAGVELDTEVSLVSLGLLDEQVYKIGRASCRERV